MLALIFSHQASHNALALVAQTPQRLSDRSAQQRQDLLMSCCHFVSRCVLLELHPLTPPCSDASVNCGACSRRSLRCHVGAFMHLERFEGLSCARKYLRRLRRFALGPVSKERTYLPCSGVSVVLLWRMLTALLALPYFCFYTFGKI